MNLKEKYQESEAIEQTNWKHSIKTGLQPTKTFYSHILFSWQRNLPKIDFEYQLFIYKYLPKFEMNVIICYS